MAPVACGTKKPPGLYSGELGQVALLRLEQFVGPPECCVVAGCDKGGEVLYG
jgi:hypothetical protein